MTMPTVNRLLCAAAAAVLSVAPVFAQGAPASQAKGAGEDIKIHGHWVIEVRNADGSLAPRHEFENALDSATGASVMTTALTSALTGVEVTPFWAIKLRGEPDPCLLGCLIVPISSGGTLQIHVPLDPSGLPQGTIQLSGFAVVSNPTGANLTLVQTLRGVLIPATNFGVMRALTSHSFPTAIPVHVGQTINVIVTLSFS